MIYATFGDSITAKYGVVVEHWPLPKFCPPSDLGTIAEVRVLFNALTHNLTQFRKLSDAEMTAWLGARASPPDVQLLDDATADSSSPAIPTPVIPAPVSGPQGAIAAPKKTRKVRSDKGVPRKKKI